MQAVRRLVAVVGVCPQGPDLVEQEVVFQLEVLDVFGGFGQDVGLVEAGRRRQPFELVEVDVGDVVEHAERGYGVLQLDELGVDVCAVLLLDLVVRGPALAAGHAGGGGGSRRLLRRRKHGPQAWRHGRRVCPHGVGRVRRHAFVPARVHRVWRDVRERRGRLPRLVHNGVHVAAAAAAAAAFSDRRTSPLVVAAQGVLVLRAWAGRAWRNTDTYLTRTGVQHNSSTAPTTSPTPLSQPTHHLGLQTCPYSGRTLPCRIIEHPPSMARPHASTAGGRIMD